MRTACVAVLLWAGSTLAAERISVAVLPPVADAKLPAGLELLMQEKASALLISVPELDVVDVRQVLSMARRHRIAPSQLFDPNTARAAAERLGVQLFVYGRLSQSKTGYTLDIATSRRADPKTSTSAVTLPAGEAAAVNEGGRALALAAATFAAKSLAADAQAQPFTTNDVAMKNDGACLKRVLEQPVGIENPSVLNEVELKKAIASCETAVKADPSFAAAWATLAFASAVAGNDARAVEALVQVKPEAGHVPAAMTARFWLVSRYQSSEAAEAVLKEALAQRPGFLLARVYLAELYNALGRHEEAAAAWRDYAAHSEGNAFVISKLAYTLARLGKTQEASTFAERAIAYDPESFDLALEYASRLIDDGRFDKAVATLAPLSTKKDAPPELWLRLGYAKLKLGDREGADALAKQALAAAKAPPEWRTRARAKLNLALSASMQDKKDDAKTLAADALKEGLRPSALPAELSGLLTPAEVAAAEAKGLGKIKTHKDASALPTVAGEVAPAAARAKAPKGFSAVEVKR